MGKLHSSPLPSISTFSLLRLVLDSSLLLCSLKAQCGDEGSWVDSGPAECFLPACVCPGNRRRDGVCAGRGNPGAVSAASAAASLWHSCVPQQVLMLLWLSPSLSHTHHLGSNATWMWVCVRVNAWGWGWGGERSPVCVWLQTEKVSRCACARTCVRACVQKVKNICGRML